MRRSRGNKRRRGGGRGARRRKTLHGRARRFKGGGGGGAKRFTTAIRKIRKLSPALQVEAMRAANDKFIRCMCRAVRKLKNKRLSPKLTADMQRNAKKIRKLIHPKTSIRTKRNMLSRRGGFLPLLLAGLAGPLISNLIGGIAGRRG